MSEQPGRYQRTSGGLAGSLIVLLAALAAFLLLRGCSRGDQDLPPPAVAYTALADQARATKALTAPRPEPLPKDWRVTSARYARSGDPTWHLGILTDRQTYLAVEEAHEKPAALVADVLDPAADRLGTVQVGSASWQAWEHDGNYALTRRTPVSTVYVGGPAGRDAVLSLVRRLR